MLKLLENKIRQNIEKDIEIVTDLLPILLKKGIAEFSNRIGMKLQNK